MAEASLRYYKKEGYEKINNSLLLYRKKFENIPEEIKAHIQNIDSVMEEAKEEVVLYRGVHDLDMVFELSNVLVHTNFCSASTRFEVASRFVGYPNVRGPRCCMVSFILPPSIRRYSYSDNDPLGESEILIQRNVQFTFRDRYRVINGIRVYEAILSEYFPPVIPEEMEKKSEKDLDVLMLSEAWEKELKAGNAKITKKAVTDLIGSKKTLNLEQDVYDQVESMLMKLVEKKKSWLVGK